MRTAIHPSKIFASIAIAFAMVASAFSPLAASSAFADSRDTDLIGNRTLGERGLLAVDAPSIDARHAYVIGEDGTVYFDRDSDAESRIASITKIMTALVAVENAPLDLKMAVSHDAATVGESTSKLQEGDVVSLQDALVGLMLPSGNDAAIVIGENVGKQILAAKAADSGASDPTAIYTDAEGMAAFVEAMNDKADELGCENTLFTNPHGLDIEAYDGELHSTAKDVAKFAKAAMDHDVFANIVCQPKANVVVERAGQPVAIEVESTDLLLESYDKARGVKTGFTSSAGSCFAGAAEDEGQMVYAIVLGSSNDTQRFTDARTLCEWVFSSKTEYPLANSDTTTTMTVNGKDSEVPVVAYAPLAAWIDKTVPVTFSDPDATVSVSSIFGNVSQGFEFAEIPGAIHAGDIVGKASFFQDNESIMTVDLVACEDVEAPNLFETIGIMWQRLTNGLSGDSRMAESYIINSTPLLIDKA